MFALQNNDINKNEGTESPLSFWIKLMEIIETLESMCTAYLPENLFVVQIEHQIEAKHIGVFIDGDTSIGINDCRNLAKHLSAQLDEMDFGKEPYMLEVSSPGADKPLLKIRQYPKHIGRELLIKLVADVETEVIGKLQEVNANEITIALKDKKTAYKQPTLKSVPFNQIKEASIILSFK